MYKDGIRFPSVPLMGWLLGALIAVVFEHYLGEPLADILMLPKIPVLFGFVIMLKKPLLIPSIIVFVLLIYALPISAVARLSAPLTNRLAAKLFSLPILISVVIHLGLLYADFTSVVRYQRLPGSDAQADPDCRYGHAELKRG